MTSRLPHLVLACCAALAVAAFAGTAAAQDPPPAPPAPAEPAAPVAPVAPAADPAAAPDPVHAAWNAFRAGQVALRIARSTGNMGATRDAQAALLSAQTAFRAAFAPTDWDAYDVAKDADLLGMGLQLVMSDATRSGDGATAVRAGEAYLAKLPATPAARGVIVRLLPDAYLVAGDVKRAVAHWEKYAAAPDTWVAAASNCALGNYRSATGDLPAAQAAWKKAADVVLTDAHRDPARVAKADAAMRLGLVGKPAPEIDSKTWIGGEAKPLSALRGSVVLVDIWHTWSEPCRAAMPALDALAKARAKDGLVVLGVTFHDVRGGFLPKPGSSEGEAIASKDLPETAFAGHLEAFRKNTGIGYPFVVAANAAPARDYDLRDFPTHYLIDREGRIAFVQTGGGDATLLRLALDRLLAPPQK